MTIPNRVDLSNLIDGAAQLLFDAALAAALENIDDPNTPAKAKRQITLTFTITADEQRRGARMFVACTSKLAPIRPLETPLHIGRDNGRMVAVEAFPQENLFPNPHGRPEAIEARPANA